MFISMYSSKGNNSELSEGVNHCQIKLKIILIEVYNNNQIAIFFIVMEFSCLTLFSLRGTPRFAERRLRNTDFRQVWMEFISCGNWSVCECVCVETSEL